MSAEHALGRARRLHRPETLEVSDSACFYGECEHPDKCPTRPLVVCRHCHDLWTQDGRYDEEAPEKDEDPVWPCPTIRAIGTGES